MGTQEQVYLAQLLPTLMLATVVLSCVWRTTKVDCYRENMFTLRDELFDYMWRNGLSFDLRAYRLMREYINGSIRIADTPVVHRATVHGATLPLTGHATDRRRNLGDRRFACS